MAAMHEDDSPDLGEVAKILNDVFEVNESRHHHIYCCPCLLV